MNGTPLPHEEPQELNPPAGVVAYYWLKSAATQPLKLELLDGAGAVRACAASDTPVRPVDTEAINVQAIWEQPAPPPSAAAGMHRFALGGAAGRGGGEAVAVRTRRRRASAGLTPALRGAPAPAAAAPLPVDAADVVAVAEAAVDAAAAADCSLANTACGLRWMDRATLSR